MGAEHSEGLEVRGVVEVVTVLLQPVADHRRQHTGSRTRDGDMVITELRADTAWGVKHLPARAHGIIQADCGFFSTGTKTTGS